MKYLILLLLFFGQIATAQNYQCLQPGMKGYFVNGNGYLRAIRIDSVQHIGDSLVYFPNHTPRGAYIVHSTLSLDSNGGSWLGKRVVQRSDGVFVFDSYWNDSVAIRTQALPGDSWVMYRDSSRLYYLATLTGIDTQTVMGVPDSVKTILITAQNDSGIVISDPLDSFTLLLSKAHGFIQVCDLYTFPYHLPDTVYRPGLDYFLDRSTCTYANVNTLAGQPPSPAATLFQLTNFLNPNDQQLYGWNAGDVYEGLHSVSLDFGGPHTNTQYVLDTVTAKTVSGHLVTYTLNGMLFGCPQDTALCPFYTDACQLVVNSGERTFADTSYTIADTGFIPELSLQQHTYVFYFPSDTSFCLATPAYVQETSNFLLPDENPPPVFYKLGLGLTQSASYDDDCNAYFLDKLVFASRAGSNCGQFQPVAVPQAPTSPKAFDVFPNPVTNILRISSADQIWSVRVIAPDGRVLLSSPVFGNEANIDVSILPPGLYMLRINNTEVQKMVKE